MQWIEVTIKTTSAAIDLVCDRLTVLGFDSFIIDDQQDFERFLEENHQYWDYVDEDLEQKMQGLSQIRLYLEDSAAARSRSARFATIWPSSGATIPPSTSARLRSRSPRPRRRLGKQLETIL